MESTNFGFNFVSPYRNNFSRSASRAERLAWSLWCTHTKNISVLAILTFLVQNLFGQFFFFCLSDFKNT